MALVKRLVMKGGVGRVLLDTLKLDGQWSLEPSASGWRMQIGGVGKELADIALAEAADIHFFYYEDDPETGLHDKWWLSDPVTSLVGYDEASGTLTIELTRRVKFTVNDSEMVHE
jgi:hypothetical protein